MPSFCVVAGCPYKETHSESINFHKFPVAKDLLARWKQFAEKPDNWQPTRLSAICSNHFTLTNFRNVKNKYLKSSAIPTIKTPVVEFNADEATAKFLDQKRPREEMSVRKPVFIHSSDLFPEHRVQKKIKIPEKFKKEFPNISNQKVKIPLEYEDEGENMEETPQPSAKQEPSNDGSFYEQFLQNSGNSDVLNQNSQNYETIEVLAEDVMVQADSTENVGEEVQTAEIMEVTEDYLEEEQEIDPYCRLCGQICEGLESFAENGIILDMIHKCFPALTIRPGDGLSSDICVSCLQTIQSFTQFTEAVTSIQKQLEEKFLSGDVQADPKQQNEQSSDSNFEDQGFSYTVQESEETLEYESNALPDSQQIIEPKVPKITNMFPVKNEQETVHSFPNIVQFSETIPGTSNDPFTNPKSMVTISMNKPNLNEPIVIQPKIEPRHYYYRPRAPAYMVVNSVCPSPFPVRKDCCRQCKLIFNHTLDYLLHKYRLHARRERISRSRYKSCSNCWKMFHSKKALLNHSFVCIFRAYSYYICNGCSLRFSDYSILKRHEKECYNPKLIEYSNVLHNQYS